MSLQRCGGKSFNLEYASKAIASELSELWNRANVPTITIRNIALKVQRFLGSFHKIRFKEAKSHQKWYKDIYADIAKDMDEIFDIKASDVYIASNSKEFRVPYGKKEQDFYDDQRSKTFLMTIAGVDKRWVQTDAEKQRKKERTEAKRQRLEERKAKWE